MKLYIIQTLSINRAELPHRKLISIWQMLISIRLARGNTGRLRGAYQANQIGVFCTFRFFLELDDRQLEANEADGGRKDN